MSGDNIPMLSYEGSKPIPAVGTAIHKIPSERAAFNEQIMRNEMQVKQSKQSKSNKSNIKALANAKKHSSGEV